MFETATHGIISSDSDRGRHEGGGMAGSAREVGHPSNCNVEEQVKLDRAGEENYQKLCAIKEW